MIRERTVTRRQRWATAVITVAALLLAAACGSSSGSSGPTPPVSHRDQPIRIVATTPIFADFARVIGGENVSVASIVPDGVDPHTYTPKAGQAQTVSQADIIFLNGLGFESKAVVDFLQQNRRSPRPSLFITMAANVPSPTRSQPPGTPIYATGVGDDPHLWLDPVLAPIYAETVADSLAIIDGKNKPFYDSNFASYRDSLHELDGYVRQKVQGIPQAKRFLVTYHGSFVHFARRYGLEIAALAVKDPASAPASDAAAGLEDAVKQHKIPAVFTEVGFSDTALRKAAADSGAKVCSLYSDTLDSHAGGYLQMMRADADALARCLG